MDDRLNPIATTTTATATATTTMMAPATTTTVMTTSMVAESQPEPSSSSSSSPASEVVTIEEEGVEDDHDLLDHHEDDHDEVDHDDDDDDIRDSTGRFRWPTSALAFSMTTPWLIRVLFPTLCLVTHLLFYYGQTADMWKLRLVADIDVWANATETTTRTTFSWLGLKEHQHYVYEEDKDVQTFTYYYAIHHLWLAKGIPGKVLPRFAAVLLIVFSGVWPHLKLALLQLTWFLRKQAAGRTQTLQWLSTLGKWSLADVLVVCVMVGVLNLDWIVDPGAIKDGIIDDLPQLLQIIKTQYDEGGLCNKLLQVKCENAKKATTRAQCKACTEVVHQAYTRPDWAQSTGKKLLNGVETSGGGMATLRVVGMSGIYAFCGAVIVSILLSLMVDIFDHRAKRELRQRQERARAMLLTPAPIPGGTSHGGLREERPIREATIPTADDQLREPLLSGDAVPLELDFGDDDSSFLGRRSYPPLPLFSCKFFLANIGTTLLILAAVDWNTMERKLFGAGPQLLHDILGVDWERNYSLRSLMTTTGAHGGWDYMLMSTFGLFCVLGPLIRGVLLILVALLDRCRLPVEPIANLVNFVGAFCSWEVFVIAIVMVQMLMPSITNTIIRNKVCEKLSEDGSCLQVEFNVLPWTFWTIVVGGLVLVVVSYVAVSRATDRSSTLTSIPGTSSSVADTRRSPLFSNVLATNRHHHDYDRLQGAERGTSDSVDDGLHELVFETNQV